jgi:LytS/YehU family sensor histidine kinase
VKLLQEQIRPHFVFNSLHIIKSLIRTDQDKAIQSLEDFSDYLQANLEVMTSNRLIPFEDELTHIEAIVSLALADKCKAITVKYDIQERYFRVPPLTIEPLVENALQHGVTNGGTVILSTCMDKEAYLITVSDDGRGMEQARTEKAKKRDGISLENVRARLAMLCSGSLELESTAHGTFVSVRIPKEKGNGFTGTEQSGQKQ